MSRRLLPASLTARVVLTVVALVALVSLLISALTTAAISGFLTGQLDDKLIQSHERSERSLEFGRLPDEVPDEGPGGPPDDLGRAFGQEAGTLTAYLASGAAAGNVIDTEGAFDTVSDDVLDQLADLEATDEPVTLDLQDLGRYRLLASTVDGITVVTGLPTSSVSQTVTNLVGWEVLFTLLGTSAAGIVAVLVVRRQLAPLREVAVTAHRVTETDLATGEIGVTARVPDRLVHSGTEVGQVAESLNTMLSHVESALASRHRSEQQVRQFVADASHELRTPLATISGYADLSLREPEPDGLTHAMGKVQTEARRMTSLVEDLLLLARLDSGRPLERTEVDVTRLVMETVADARVTGADHRWLLELPEEAVTVTGDDLRLHQVLSNLLSNARRHTPAGTTVTTCVASVGGEAGSAPRVLVTVTDDGPGISPELLPDVFTRFTRGDSARTRAASGAGLGLSLAHAIAVAHGGTLAVESRPGHTRFTLSLPVSGAEQAGTVAASA